MHEILSLIFSVIARVGRGGDRGRQNQWKEVTAFQIAPASTVIPITGADQVFCSGRGAQGTKSSNDDFLLGIFKGG